MPKGILLGARRPRLRPWLRGVAQRRRLHRPQARPWWPRTGAWAPPLCARQPPTPRCRCALAVLLLVRTHELFCDQQPCNACRVSNYKHRMPLLMAQGLVGYLFCVPAVFAGVSVNTFIMVLRQLSSNHYGFSSFIHRNLRRRGSARSARAAAMRERRCGVSASMPRTPSLRPPRPKPTPCRCTPLHCPPSPRHAACHFPPQHRACCIGIWTCEIPACAFLGFTCK